MRKYFKAYIKSQSKRRVAAAGVLALRALLVQKYKYWHRSTESKRRVAAAGLLALLVGLLVQKYTY
jgi:hypothetical protein